jgi:chorismate--pyruvate lyase
MTRRFLSDADILKLDRDLRILIATNGTLTRILNIIGDDEIFVQIVEQRIHPIAPKIREFAELSTSRILQRQVLLRGRSSAVAFIAAESLIAIDLLPPAIITRLTGTDCPIGEVIAASCLETFKEKAQVWIGALPGWIPLTKSQNDQSKTVGRRYSIIAGGRPLMVITEYFLRDKF